MKPGSCPFPDIALHIKTTVGALACGMLVDTSCASCARITITSLSIQSDCSAFSAFSPWLRPLGIQTRIPCGCFFPLSFSWQAFTECIGICFCLVPTDTHHGMMRNKCMCALQANRSPASIALFTPIQRVFYLVFLPPRPAFRTPVRTLLIAPILDKLKEGSIGYRVTVNLKLLNIHLVL